MSKPKARPRPDPGHAASGLVAEIMRAVAEFNWACGLAHPEPEGTTARPKGKAKPRAPRRPEGRPGA